MSEPVAIASAKRAAPNTREGEDPVTDAVPTSGAATDAEAIRPFRVAFKAEAFIDLHQRLTATRWPDDSPLGGWTQGVPLAKARAVVDYWMHRYDMMRVQRRLNNYAQFCTKIDGLDIHFIHVKSRHPNALPVIITHGWPGSVIELLDLIEPLVDPTAHGGSDNDAFDVVIPSLPGFGFSQKPTEAGWGLPRIARAWGVLMQRLGYTHYVAQGGDLGAGVSNWMADQRPEGLKAIHLNLPMVFPPPPAGPQGYTNSEEATIAQLNHVYADMSGYAFIQDTKPQTLSYGLTDSPVGQALWIFEKFQEWTDNHGNATDALSMDRMLDNITLYWMTQTAGSAAKLYKESFKKDFVRIAISLPTAITVFKGDIFTPPRVWAERTYSNLIYWNEIAKGGHFAAFEQPLSLAKELRISMRIFRKSGL